MTVRNIVSYKGPVKIGKVIVKRGTLVWKGQNNTVHIVALKKQKLLCILGLGFQTLKQSQTAQMENLSHPHFHFDSYEHTYALKPAHTHTRSQTYKDMLDPPSCLCPHAIVFIRGYWLAGQIFQALAGELSNEADHFQQAFGPPPPK